jgi:TolB protein
MKKKYLYAIVLLLAPFLLNQLASAKIYIDIRSPSFRKFPIALAPFKSLTLPSQDIKLGEQGRDILKEDLDISGFFSLLTPETSPEKTGGSPSAPGQVTTGGTTDFQPWANLGAEALVTGVLTYKNGSLMLEARLYDVVNKEMIVGKRYTGEVTDLSRMVHRFADEIVFAITGEQGFFQTRIIFVSTTGGSKELFLMDWDGRNVTQITRQKSIILSPRVSPDGTKVAFTSYKMGNPDLYVKDLRTGEEKRVSHYPGLNMSPAWSPDGKRIALTLSKDGNPEIYTMNPDGSGLVRLTHNPAIDVSPTWSPDGQKIAFVSSREGYPQIYIMEASGQNVQRLTFEGNYNTQPSWAPRGDRIAFDATLGGGRNICTIRPDGTDLRVLSANLGSCEMPAWSPDGRDLIFISDRDGGSDIFLMDAEGTRVKRLTFQSGTDSFPCWIPRVREPK